MLPLYVGSAYSDGLVFGFRCLMSCVVICDLLIADLVFNNETSLECREYFLSQRLPVQFVPSQIHRSNSAEKSVRTSLLISLILILRTNYVIRVMRIKDKEGDINKVK
jgi:hypothetical protein